MKKLFFITILIFCCTLTQAQDTIVKTNGDIIFAKITEVSSIEVKYKKFDFLDGPTYIESKSNLKLIKYSNGSKEEFVTQQPKSAEIQTDNSNDYYSGPVNTNNKIERYGNHFRYRDEMISEYKLHEILFNSHDKQIIVLAGNAKDAKGLQYIGFGAIPLGVGAIYFLTRGIFSQNYYNGQKNNDLTYSALCLVGAVSCPIASVYFKHKRNTSNREAIKLYNERF